MTSIFYSIYKTGIFMARPNTPVFSLLHSFLSNGNKIKQSTSTTAQSIAETELGTPPPQRGQGAPSTRLRRESVRGTEAQIQSG